MKDYNTITADLLKNAPHGIDCYVSNVSYAEALQDIHCTGDAVRRVKYWGKDSAGEHMLWDGDDMAWTYVVPVHLVVKELLDGLNGILDYQDSEFAKSALGSTFNTLLAIEGLDTTNPFD